MAGEALETRKEWSMRASSRHYYLGLDLGTSALKSILIDDEQTILATHSETYPTQRGEEGEATQDPQDWVRAWERSMDGLAQQISKFGKGGMEGGLGRVKAIGLSGQMHSLVTLDKNGGVLYPAIIWSDRRGATWANLCYKETPSLAKIAGVRPMPGFTAAKLAWLADAEPDLITKLAKILLPKDYLRFYLTGEIGTDYSDAAGTWLFDQEGRQWSKQILDRLGLSQSICPPVTASNQIVGYLKPGLASRWGLSPHVAVVAGAADAVTNLLGAGCYSSSKLAEAGNSLISLGTGSVWIAPSAAYRPLLNPNLHHFCHGIEHRYYRMAALLNCGNALRWLLNLVGISEADFINQHLPKLTAESLPLHHEMILPYLDGERCPHGFAEAQGMILGLTSSTNPSRLLAAMIEGICMTLADAGQSLKEDGADWGTPLVIGGGSQSREWCQILATILKRPLARVIAAQAGASLGAARLSLQAVQGLKSEEVYYKPATELIDPLSSHSQLAQARLTKFRQAWDAIEAFALAGDKSA